METFPRDEHPHELRRTLLVFAEAVLRPIIRILLRYGLSYPEFNQVARKLFVDVAMQEPEFRIARRKRQYKSRVALLTALSRKEVLRLLDSERPADDPDIQQSNRAARVLEGWLNDERFLDSKGRPLPLPFKAADGRRSFSQLVAEYSGDIPPRAVLDDLVATGTCLSSDDSDIRIARRNYVARSFDVESMAATAMRTSLLLSRMDEQLLPGKGLREVPDALVSGTAEVA